MVRMLLGENVSDRIKGTDQRIVNENVSYECFIWVVVLKYYRYNNVKQDIPIVLYGCETWSYSSALTKITNILKQNMKENILS